MSVYAPANCTNDSGNGFYDELNHLSNRKKLSDVIFERESISWQVNSAQLNWNYEDDFLYNPRTETVEIDLCTFVLHKLKA